jgi:hypothetical protein
MTMILTRSVSKLICHLYPIPPVIYLGAFCQQYRMNNTPVNKKWLLFLLGFGWDKGAPSLWCSRTFWWILYGVMTGITYIHLQHCHLWMVYIFIPIADLLIIMAMEKTKKTTVTTWLTQSTRYMWYMQLSQKQINIAFSGMWHNILGLMHTEVSGWRGRQQVALKWWYLPD